MNRADCAELGSVAVGIGIISRAIRIPEAQLMSGCVSWEWNALHSQRMEGANLGESWSQCKRKLC